MKPIISSTLLVLAFCAVLTGAEDSRAADAYKALLEEYEKEGGARLFAKRFLAFANDHPQDSTAVDALLWVVKNVRGRRETTQALTNLAKRVDSIKLADACADIAKSRSTASEKLLRKIMSDSPHEKMRAQACFHLAALLDNEALVVDQLQAAPELAPRALQYYGPEYGKHLSSLVPAELTRQREKIYEHMSSEFPNLEIQNKTLGKIAKQELFAIRHLSIGRIAPDIDGEDIEGNRFKLSDYRGKIVMVTFWGHW